MFHHLQEKLRQTLSLTMRILSSSGRATLSFTYSLHRWTGLKCLQGPENQTLLQKYRVLDLEGHLTCKTCVGLCILNRSQEQMSQWQCEGQVTRFSQF